MAIYAQVERKLSLKKISLEFHYTIHIGSQSANNKDEYANCSGWIFTHTIVVLLDLFINNDIIKQYHKKMGVILNISIAVEPQVECCSL